MKNTIEAINKMNPLSFRLLRFCLGAVLCSSLICLVYSLGCGEYEREVMRMYWSQDLQYIFTSVSIAFGGATAFEMQLRVDPRE